MGHCNFLPEYMKLAFIDCLKFIPLLYFLYFAIELFERHFLKNIDFYTKLVQKLGAIFGIAISVIPECGFSVIGSTFYSRKMISRGTLLAFFIMCSDDALPLLFMDFSKIKYIIPILTIKAIIALVVAYSFNFMTFIIHKGQNTNEKINSINTDINIPACCHHRMMTIEHAPYWYMHPFTHTINIFVFSFITLTLIYGGIQTFGTEYLADALFINSPLQVILCAALGIVSNCVISVVVALAFVKGLLSFPAFIAALISRTGLGLYTLLKQNVPKNEISAITFILFIIALAAGLALYYIPLVA